MSPPALVTILTPLVDGEAERLLHLAQERLGVAQLRVLGPVSTEDEHRQLGEVVAGEHVELATGEHLVHRGEAVAVETRSVADAQGIHARPSSGVLACLVVSEQGDRATRAPPARGR